MGLFDKIERGLEGAVNGAFARAFKGDVQPVEISSALQKQLDSEASSLSKDKKLAPNDFTVYLSKHDYDRLAPYSRTLNSEIIPELRRHAGERGYVFNGAINISYELDEDLTTGRFKVASRGVAGVSDQLSGQAPSSRHRAPLVLEVNGVRHPLTPPGFTIGRGTEADLRINDPGISRKHARIDIEESGDELVISIHDLGSTNGIILNGEKVTDAMLGEGARIEIGTTRMLVHSPVGE